MGKNILWAAVAIFVLIVVGWIAISILGTVLKLAFYLLIGAAVVGGGYYLFGRGRSRQR